VIHAFPSWYQAKKQQRIQFEMEYTLEGQELEDHPLPASFALRLRKVQEQLDCNLIFGFRVLRKTKEGLEAIKLDAQILSLSRRVIAWTYIDSAAVSYLHISQ
jgi:hypothetical protein